MIKYVDDSDDRQMIGYGYMFLKMGRGTILTISFLQCWIRY